MFGHFDIQNFYCTLCSRLPRNLFPDVNSTVQTTEFKFVGRVKNVIMYYEEFRKTNHEIILRETYQKSKSSHNHFGIGIVQRT